jgi:hypothetical protein
MPDSARRTVMHRVDTWGSVIVCAAAFALLTVGCGGPRTGASADPSVDPGYPDWVRIVPPATEGATYFVGAVARVSDVETGIESAMSDAVSQAVEGQRRHFIQLFDRAASESGVETTSEMRMEFRTGIADELSGRLRPAVHREAVHHRRCEGEAPCEVYVLARLDHLERNQIFEEALSALGQRKQREGRGDVALLIEWILRNL